MSSKDLSFLIDYKESWLISKDLELIQKKDVAGSSFVYKFYYFVAGTYNSDKTAEAIHKCVMEYLANNELSIEKLEMIKTKLDGLHLKISQGKNTTMKKNATSTLELTLYKVEECLSKKRKTSVPSTAPISSPFNTRPAQQKPIPLHPQPSNPKVTLPKSHRSPEPAKKEQLPEKLVKELSNIQSKINSLNPNSSKLKKQAKGIYRELKKITREHQDLKQPLQPLIQAMDVIRKKGTDAFKPDVVQERLCKSLGLEEFAEEEKLTSLNEIIKLLKLDTIDFQNITQSLINRSSQIENKWKSISDDLFEGKIKGRSRVMKKNILNIKELLTKINKRLQSEYKEFLDKHDAYQTPGFQELISHYPDHNIKLNQDSILGDVMDILIEEICPVHSKLATEMKDLTSEEEENFELFGINNLKGFLSPLIDRYDWLQANIPYIITPYEQSTEKGIDLGKGICMLNSYRRYEILFQQPKILTKKIEMGSDETVRKRLKSIHARMAKGESASSVQNPANFGINIDQKKLRLHTLKNDELNSYRRLVDQLIGSEKKNILGFLFMKGEGITNHMVNIQVDYNLQNFRILDDNIGAIEFPSIEEFKEGLATYLKCMYTDYSEFCMMVPKS